MIQGMDIKPVFIGGCSRSGTTLLGAMLGAHSEMVATPESHFKTEVYFTLNHPADEIIPALEKIIRHHRFRHWSLPLKDRQAIIDRAQSSYPRLILALVEAYCQKHGKEAPTGLFWVDHTPSNIRHAHLLASLFPNLKMIHIVRDGRAVAASLRRLDWGPNTAIGAARFWLESIAFGLAAEQFLGPARILRIAYEALVSDPVSSMQSICEFIDIPFERRMINGAGFSPPAYTKKQHRLVSTPPDAAVAEKWKRKLSPRQIREFEGVTADMLQYLGYDRRYNGKAAYPDVLARLKAELSDFFGGYLINKLKHHYRRSR